MKPKREKREKVLRIRNGATPDNFWLTLACGHTEQIYTYSTRPIRTAVCGTCYTARRLAEKQAAMKSAGGASE